MRRAPDTPTRAADGVDARAAELVRDAVLADLARRVVADCGVDVGLVGVPDRLRPVSGAGTAAAGAAAERAVPGARGTHRGTHRGTRGGTHRGNRRGTGPDGAPATVESVGRPGAGSADGPAGMVLRHWSGTRADLLHDLVVPIGTGLGGRALAERAPTWVPDYRAATTISHDYDAAVDAEDLYAMLTVPLLHGGAVHGVVYAAIRAVVPFGDVRIGAVTDLALAATRALAGAAAWSGSAGRPAGPPGGATGQRLTPREHEVLRWAATGRTNPEIAAQLGLTCNTVTGYLKSAMHKLGVRNRVELTLAARESGLLG